MKSDIYISPPGGVNAAAAGTLTFMVGADSEEIFSEAKSILEGYSTF